MTDQPAQSTMPEATKPEAESTQAAIEQTEQKIEQTLQVPPEQRDDEWKQRITNLETLLQELDGKLSTILERTPENKPEAEPTTLEVVSSGEIENEPPKPPKRRGRNPKQLRLKKANHNRA